MAEVEGNLEQAENLATEGEQQHQGAEDDPPSQQQNASGSGDTPAAGDAPGDSAPARDAPEGSELVTATQPPGRLSPEGQGLQDGVPQQAPKTSGDEDGSGQRKEADGEGNGIPHQSNQEDKKDDNDDDEDAKDDTNDQGEGEHQPPPTPTFSDDNDNSAGNDDVDDVSRQQAQAALEAQKALEASEREATTSAEAGEADHLTPLVTPSGGAPLPNVKRLTTTPLDGAVLPLKPPTAQLPPVARGQVRGQQMTSAITDALKQGGQPPLPKQPIRSRRPPKYIRLTTVTVSPARARQLPQGPSLYYEEPRRPRKVISWDEAHNARPPLRIDMEGPGPCTYTPRVKPLNETNAPSFSFGSRCQPEKAGGSRTAWTKSWFQTPHVWNNKVDFTRETVWPSPSHYPKGSSLGPRQRTMPEAPSFTFGHKMAYSIIKPGASKEPSPNEYRRQMADKLILARGPSFTHQLRREGTVLWGASEATPGPAAYSPQKQGTERPSFTIQGIRRDKSHMLGPYSSL